MTENERPIKVAIVGTSCIGKTTLIKEYRKKFRGDPTAIVVPEAARDFFTRYPEVTDRLSFEAQGRVQALALRREQRAQQNGVRTILCDRSVLDAPVYVRSQGDRSRADELFRRVEFWLPTYTALFLLDPADVPYKTDSIRQEDETIRQGIHEAFLDFFNEKEVSFELLRGTFAERLRRVDQVLAGGRL